MLNGFSKKRKTVFIRVDISARSRHLSPKDCVPNEIDTVESKKIGFSVAGVGIRTQTLA
jgi:hypothetical protein